MFKTIIWITLILALSLHASAERNISKHTEKIRCFDGQLSFIEYKNNLFYSSLNNKFLIKEDAAKDSCKKQHLSTRKNAIVCTKKQDVIKTIQALKKKKHLLYASCLALQEELNLVVSSHAYYDKQRSYFYIKYHDNDLFIPKAFIYPITPHLLQQTKSYHKKHHKIYKHKTHKKYKRLHKKKKHHFHPKKHTKRKHPKRKKHKHYQYHNQNQSHIYRNNKSTQKTIPSTHKSYTYKCIGSHGNVNISATDDNSISMASDILWRMCQKLKTVDEVCKIRDCYKLIR